MGQCQEKGIPQDIEGEGGEPVYYYFPFAGRGEITRLCAAAGGLKITESPIAGFDTERTALCKECGCVATGLPVLKHASLKMCQSVAIQNYICAISPKFKPLPYRTKAIDAMYFSTVEDLLADVSASGFFGQLFGGPPMDKDKLKAAMEKWCGYFEGQVPTAGFINGSMPTGADCVLVCIWKAAVPWSFMFEFSGVSKESYTKVNALVDRTCKSPGVAEYLAKSTSINANPFAK